MTHSHVSTAPVSPGWADYSADLDLPPVLSHALDAFVEHGYHASSVRDLAKRLGQTVPAIYYHYENKQAILVALLSRSIDDLLERLRAADDEATDEPREKLSQLVRCIVLFVAQRHRLALLDAEIRSLEPQNREAYIAMRDEIQQMVSRVVEQGIGTGEFADGDARAIARAIITMCRGISTWFRLEGPMSSADLAELYVTLSLRLAGDRTAS